MIGCPADRTLSDYLTGRISADELDVVSEHLALCVECVERLAQLDAATAPVLAALASGPAVADGAYSAAVEQLLRIDPARPPRPAVQVGSILREYELLEKIGEGGMGTVYRAIHARLDKIVAVKVLRREPWDDPAAVLRFDREMKAVGRLRHPNIVTATDAGDADGQPFLVMEYVEGRNLSKQVREDGPLATPDAIAIVRDVARGLQHAHAAGLIHRDVKPSNLIRTADGSVKILDLGLALVPVDAPAEVDTVYAGGSTSTDLTSASRVVGTIDYMAPEQKANAHAVDPRADVYGLGCTLWFLLTGKPPAAGDGLADGPLPGNLPAPVWRQFLAGDPTDRFPSMTAVFEALTPPTAKRSRLRRKRMLVGLTVASIVAGVSIAFAAVAGKRPQRTADVTAPTTAPSVEVPTPRAVPKIRPVEPRGPLSADASRDYQEKWAEFLGRPVVDANSLGMTFALIPPGDVELTPDAKARITRPYEMSLHEVTRAQFGQYLRDRKAKSMLEIMGAEGVYRVWIHPDQRNPVRPVVVEQVKNPAFNWLEPGYSNPGENDPVAQVTRFDAVAFCNWLEERDGRKYRLPTEAEWLWAGRAGQSDKEFALGGRGASFSVDYGWGPSNSPDRPRAVGTKRPNPWRLFDTVGNVSEWCQGNVGNKIPAGASVDPVGSTWDGTQVCRGDSYCTSPSGLRDRSVSAQTFACSSIGFRVLRTIPNATQFPTPTTP